MIFKILQNLRYEQEMGGDYFIQKILFLFHIISAKIFIIFQFFSFLFTIFTFIMLPFNNVNLLF